MSVLAALLPLALALAMTTISCENTAGGGREPTVEPAGLSGTWVNKGTNTFVVLEFTASQLLISGTEATTAYYISETGGEIKIGTSAGNIDEVFCESYEISAGVLTFTGGKSEDDYPSANFYKVNTLTADQWNDGAISSDSQGQVWYSFKVAAETTYRMWWNDGYDGGGLFGTSPGGNGTKTLDIYVSAYYSSGTSAFTRTDNGWGTARSFTPTATQAGTVYVQVTPFSTTGVPTGTFALLYSSTATTRPAAPFNPSATALTENQWKDGEITAASNGAAWYSFNVSIGTIYNVWWNEDSTNSNGTKTLDVKVSGYYSDGTSIFAGADSAWNTARSITPTTKDGTVYLKVMPYTAGQTGTFGIVYNTGLNADRPGVAFNPPNPTALDADEWADGEITSDSNSAVWYSLAVTAETDYYFWWNESGSNGNGFKTLDIRVTAYNSEGTVISDFNNVTTAWADAQSYTPAVSGTIYLRVTPATSGQTGTYGIVYSESDSMPPAPFNPPSAIALATDVWAEGELTSSIREAWYSFDVSSDTAYRVWWNDLYAGDYTKTLNVSVSGFYSNGTSIFTDGDAAWNYPRTINPNASQAGTVYLKVTPSSSSGTGTFGIVYSDNTSIRPPVPFVLPSTATPLTANTWADGSISSSVREVWYSFDVSSDTAYRVWWNDSYECDGSKTMDVAASAWYSGGTNIFEGVNSGWYDPPSFTPAANGTVYVKITPYSSTTATGTFGITYNADSATRPPIPIDPVSPTALTVDVWEDDAISAAGGELWYSFPVTSDTSYYIWLNEVGESDGDGLKTLDVTAKLYYTDGTFLGTLNASWDHAPMPIAPAANDTVYIRITAASSSGTGTFGVAYSTSSTRPPAPFEPPSLTELTVDVWEDGEITSSTSPREAWYSFTIETAVTHYLWWNDAHTGDGTKTLNVKVSVWYSDGTSIVTNFDAGWGGYPITGANRVGTTVYVRVIPFYTTGSTGTFGIVYSTTNTRPQ